MRAVTGDWISTALLVTFLVGQVLGMLLLGAAIWRARVAPRFAAVLIALGPIVGVVVHGSHAASAVVWAFVGVGLAACAREVLRTDDADWDLPAVAIADRIPAEVSGTLVRATPAGG
jgi:hypothetical protein